MDEFTTGKHHQLMGWFNKKYIYEYKIFDAELIKIYQKLLLNRQKLDYDVSENPQMENVLENLKMARYFVKIVKSYMLQF